MREPDDQARRPDAAMAGHPARQPRWAPARGRLHEDRLVQALVLLHVPRHRPRVARDRNGRRDRRHCPAAAPVVERSHRRNVRHVGRAEHRRRLPRRRATSRSTLARSGTTAPARRSRTSCSSPSSASRCSPRSSRWGSSFQYCSVEQATRSAACTSRTSSAQVSAVSSRCR